jgi:hypothetical protein
LTMLIFQFGIACLTLIPAIYHLFAASSVGVQYKEAEKTSIFFFF